MKIIPPLTDKYKISSPFGWRTHPITGKRKLHTGVDLVTRPVLSAIVAPEDGKIIEARKSTAPGGGYGWFIKMRGVSGATHIFAHLLENSIKVQKGQRVKQKDQLAIMGTSGASTGKHLHWEVRGKIPVDPIKWMAKQNA